MTYQETIEFLYSQLPVYHRIGRAAYKSDLKNSIALDEYFGYPHRKFRSVHIAGTNGKGSVSHMLASVLQEAGYRTGLYTSPHLKDFRERIRINGVEISEDEVVGFIERNSGLILSLEPSFFELSVAMAFNYFAVKEVDIAIIETGLGGRLDSTNIITPLLSVITNIGYDHMDLLGTTLNEIGREKAGIIKKNIPVIIGESHPETKHLFIEKAMELSCRISFADEVFECRMEEKENKEGYRPFILINRSDGTVISGESALGGDYQVKNIPVTALAAEYLKTSFSLSDKNILEGIRRVVINTGLRGRWQILGRNPLIICDTGHNRQGLEYVMNQLKSIPRKTLHIVTGFVNDKDLDSLLPLFPVDAEYYFTKASVPRALNEILLMNIAMKFGLRGNAFPEVVLAFNEARSKAGKEDVIFVGGSTFVVAEVV